MDKEEQILMKELAKDVKASFIEFMDKEELSEDEMLETKDLVLKFDKLSKKDEFNDDDIAFVDSYFDDDEITEDEADDFNDEVVIEKSVIRRRDIAKRKERHRSYLGSKSKVKNKIKRYRMTGAYKKYKAKAKRLGKFGKTASGKRKTKWINN